MRPESYLEVRMRPTEQFQFETPDLTNIIRSKVWQNINSILTLLNINSILTLLMAKLNFDSANPTRQFFFKLTIKLKTNSN